MNARRLSDASVACLWRLAEVQVRNVFSLARRLGQLVMDAWTILAEQQRRQARCPALLMRRVIERGPENLRNGASAAAGAEWGYCGDYVLRAAKVAAWSPELAARVAAGEYWMNAAIEDERAHRLGAWHVRHPDTPPPLPGPSDPLPTSLWRATDDRPRR